MVTHNYSNCDLISYSVVVARAKMELDISGTDYDKLFEMYLDDTLRNFDSMATLGEKIVCVEVCENRFNIPKGCKQILGIKYDFCDYNNQSHQVVTTGTPPYTTNVYYFYGNYAANNFIENILNINNGVAEIKGCPPHLVTRCLVWFKGANLDGATQDYLIYNEYEACLAHWLVYRFLLKSPAYINSDPRLTASLRAEHYQWYLAQKKKLKASEQQVKEEQNKFELAVVLNRMRIDEFPTIYGVVI